MTEYYRRVTCWVTKAQSDKIRKSGLSDSDFVREAIDEKDYQFAEMKRRMEDHVIDDVIMYLSDKRGVDCQTTCQTNHGKNDEFVRQLYDEIASCQTNLSDKQDKFVRQTPQDVFGNSLQTVVNLIHFNGKLNATQKEVISAKLGISKKLLQDYIDEYYDELLQMDVGR